VMPHMQAIKGETLSTDVRATYEWLTSASQVDKNATTCVGYCLGGRASFLATFSKKTQSDVQRERV